MWVRFTVLWPLNEWWCHLWCFLCGGLAILTSAQRPPPLSIKKCDQPREPWILSSHPPPSSNENETERENSIVVYSWSILGCTFIERETVTRHDHQCQSVEEGEDNGNGKVKVKWGAFFYYIAVYRHRCTDRRNNWQICFLFPSLFMKQPSVSLLSLGGRLANISSVTQSNRPFDCSLLYFLLLFAKAFISLNLTTVDDFGIGVPTFHW